MSTILKKLRWLSVLLVLAVSTAMAQHTAQKVEPGSKGTLPTVPTLAMPEANHFGGLELAQVFGNSPTLTWGDLTKYGASSCTVERRDNPDGEWEVVWEAEAVDENGYKSSGVGLGIEVASDFRMILHGGDMDGYISNTVTAYPTTMETWRGGWSKSDQQMYNLVGLKLAESFTFYVNAYIDEKEKELTQDDNCFYYQWYRRNPNTYDMTLIEGATQKAYTPVIDDAGYELILNITGDEKNCSFMYNFNYGMVYQPIQASFEKFYVDGFVLNTDYDVAPGDLIMVSNENYGEDNKNGKSLKATKVKSGQYAVRMARDDYEYNMLNVVGDGYMLVAVYDAQWMDEPWYREVQIMAGHAGESIEVKPQLNGKTYPAQIEVIGKNMDGEEVVVDTWKFKDNENDNGEVDNGDNGEGGIEGDNGADGKVEDDDALSRRYRTRGDYVEGEYVAYFFLFEGTYYLRTTLDDEILQTYYPNSVTFADATPIEVVAVDWDNMTEEEMNNYRTPSYTIDMVPMPAVLEGTGMISGSLENKPDGNVYAYLKDKDGDIVSASPVYTPDNDNVGEFGFIKLPFGDYQVLIDALGYKMPQVQTVSVTEAAPKVEGVEYLAENFEIVTKGDAIDLAVVGKDQKVLTEGFEVQWFDKDMELISSGKSLRNRTEGEEVYYSVLIGKDLSGEYRDAIMKEAVFSDTTITCQLEPMQKVKLTGQVSAMDIDTNPATVKVVQMLNGRYETTFDPVRTDDKGAFTIEIYDDETDITVSRGDCVDATIHRDGFGKSGDVGTIPLSLLDGVYLAVDLTYQTAVKKDATSETLTVSGGLGDFDITIKNGSTEITDFVVQNSSLLIKSGAAEGNTISLTLKSKQGLYADVTGEFTVQAGSNNILLKAKELGGLCATATSKNASDVGYVYDASGVLVTRAAYNGDDLDINHLASGDYTLVSMKKSQMLGSVQTLASLANIGLTASDYVQSALTITDGVITEVAVGEIPTFNESAISRLTDNSYFSADKTVTYVGDYLTFTSHIEMKEGMDKDISTIALVFDLPEGCSMSGTTAQVGRKNVAFTKSGNTVTVPLTKDNYADKIRFCAAPNKEKDFVLTSYVKIGEDILQPIGSTQFSVKGFPINLPQKAASEKITVSGTAPVAGEVKVYDNDNLVGTATVPYKGATWKAECILDKAYDNTIHTIYAKINDLTSETKSIEYDPNVIAPVKTTILYYNREFDNTYNIVFDYADGTTSHSYYYFYPFKYDDWWVRRDTEDKAFTFVADFTENDPEKIKNIDFKVLASDGTLRTLPGTFDEKKHAWVATSKYSSNRLPVNVALDYDMLVSSGTNHEKGLNDQGNSMVNLSSKIYQYLQGKVAATKVSETEKSMKFSFSLSVAGVPVPFYGQIDEIDYATVEEQMGKSQFTYATTESGTIGSLAEWDNTGIKATFADLTQKYAVRVSLAMQDNLDWTLKKDEVYDLIDNLSQLFSNGGFMQSLGTYGGKLVELAEATDYFNVRKDFENMLNIANYYSTSYDRLSTLLTSAMNAKCPDGTKRLTNDQITSYTTQLEEINKQGAAFIKDYNEFMKAYQHKLISSVITDAASGVAGQALGTVADLAQFKGTKAAALIAAQLGSIASGEQAAAILANALGVAMKRIETNATQTVSADDFKKAQDYVLKWSAEQNLAILNKYADLKKTIRDHYKRCDYIVDLDEFIQDNGIFQTPSTQPILDPSGFVYEGVISNRLAGVTTTVYKKGGDGNPEKWDAAAFGQENPLTTDVNGFYQWNVPEGEWQVKYEKEGYETVTSEWLPVPPPQLDVNQAMTSSTAPAVEEMKGYESGIVIDMSKYMLVSTLTDANITVTRNGNAEKGKVEMLNEDKATDGTTALASKLKFVPETDFAATDEVIVTVSKAVKSYSDVAMADDYTKTVPIVAEIKQIVVDEEMKMAYNGEKELSIIVLPKEASANKKLEISSSSEEIVSLDKKSATIDEEGKAKFTMTGELLGEAYLTIKVAETDVVETTKVTVIEGGNTVATPQPSLNDGTLVPTGAKLELTSETEGATIYYTLDGSCPCDEETRVKYTEPIAVTADISINVLAVKDGWLDSEIGTYTFTVTDKTATITLSQYGKTTYCGNEDLDFSFSNEVKAFVATGFDKGENTIWMTRVKDVPAGVPVMIKGVAEKSYEIPVTSGGTSYYANMFKGNDGSETMVISPTEEDGKYVNYYMSKGQFVSVNGTANITANKCYLRLPATFEAEATGADQSVKIATSGKSSYAAPFDLDFTSLGDDVRAFTATGYDASTKTVWLSRVKKVQQGEGLMLKGTASETYAIPSTGVQAIYMNLIVGNTSGDAITVYPTSEDGEWTNYYLKGGTYMSVSGNVSIGNNKSYLQLPTSMLAGARGEDAEGMQSEYTFVEMEMESMPIIFASIGNDGDGTTGIKDNNRETITNDRDDQWYTLGGQRISKPTQKGLYIHNGRKVVVR